MKGEPGTSESRGTADGFPVGGLVALISLACYLVFLPASVYWLDSPEFMTAAARLSLPHPPGHPVAVMLMKLFTLLPLGDVPFRANLFGALCGAVAAGLVASIARVAASGLLHRIGRGGDPGRNGWFAVAAALASGLMFAGCRSMFIQSMAAEVYTLNGALLLGALYIVMPGPGDARRGMAAAVLLGLALANHHFLALLAVPTLVVAYWGGKRPVAALLRIAVTAALVAVACYLFIAVRSAAGAWPVWGRINGLSEFFWYVSASIFSQSVGGFESAGGGPAQNLGLAFFLIGSSLGVLSPVLALGGCWLVARSGGLRHATALVLLFVGGLVSKVMMGLLDPSNPDDHGYFMMAIAALSIMAPLIVLLPVGLSGRSRAGAAVRALSIAAFVALAAWPFRGGIGVGIERAAFDHTDRLARLVWDDVPAGAAAFVSHYPVFFVLQYQQEVEDARPDVTLVQESLYFKARGGAWYADDMSRRDLSLGGLMADFRESGRLSWNRLRELAGVRPVVIEASPDFDAKMADVSPAGWFFRLGGESVPGAAAAHADRVARIFGPAAAVNVETRRVAVRNLASSADWLARGGDAGSAASLLRAALVFNPDDRSVRGRLAAVAGERGEGQ